MLTFSDRFDLVRAGCKRERGQTLPEYAVIMAVITLATVAAFGTLSGGIQGTLNSVIALLS